MKHEVYEIVVIGVSAGALAALQIVLPALPVAYALPVVVVQHLHPWQENTLIFTYDEMCAVEVKEADEKESIRANCIYFAPPNYHLLIEDDRTFTLSIDPKVHFSRPAVDVLFESAVDVYGSGVVGVILTGANHDGAAGLQCIKRAGGLAVVQDPQTAVAAAMPQAAIDTTIVDYVLPLAEIGSFLATLGR